MSEGQEISWPTEGLRVHGLTLQGEITPSETGQPGQGSLAGVEIDFDIPEFDPIPPQS